MSNRCSLPPGNVPLSWCPSLFDHGAPRCDPDFSERSRTPLPPDAWVDHQERWLTGAGTLFDALLDELGWAGRTVTMYGERLDQPRLTAAWRGPRTHPRSGPVVEQMRRALSDSYGRSFRSVGCNLYRDGADSVAWHGDRVLRDRVDALVAIVSVGEPRPFRLRPRGGGPSIGFSLGAGDLLVMGGSCQRTWQHAVPKVRRAGPRISITFRPERAPGTTAAPTSSTGRSSTRPSARDRSGL